MKRGFLAIIFLASYIGISAASLTISVKLPDGSPANDVEVYMRDEMTRLHEIKLGKTDEKGSLKLTLKKNWEPWITTGYGVFMLAVKPRMLKWETSAMYYWIGGKYEKELNGDYELCKKTGCNCVKITSSQELEWQVALKETVTATVKIIDENEKPIRAAHINLAVYLYSSPMRKDRLSHYSSIEPFSTDENGELIIKNYGPHVYFLQIPGYEYINTTGESSGKPGTIFSFPTVGGTVLKFKKIRQQDITVYVKNFETKLSIKDACVNISRNGNARHCLNMTDLNGSSELIVRPETADKLGVSKKGYSEIWRDIDYADTIKKYEFELKKKE